MMMAATMNTATSESARSSIFDLGVAVCRAGAWPYAGGVVEPTADVEFHGVARYDQHLGVTAPLALKRAAVAVDLPRLNLHKNFTRITRDCGHFGQRCPKSEMG
jgi:hypothetical protein